MKFPFYFSPPLDSGHPLRMNPQKHHRHLKTAHDGPIKIQRRDDKRCLCDLLIQVSDCIVGAKKLGNCQPQFATHKCKKLELSATPCQFEHIQYNRSDTFQAAQFSRNH